MDIANTAPIERVARVLAGYELSRNGGGDMASADEAVDGLWPDFTGAALAILKTLREPSAAMALAGDPAIWERMMLAAIEDETISES
ncbi:MAG: hypothetical protein V4530_01940 [Pseudomonadota bacterium]